MSVIRLLRIACLATLSLPAAVQAQLDSAQLDSARAWWRTREAVRDSTCAAWQAALHARGAAALRDSQYQRMRCGFPHDSTLGRIWRTIGTDTTELLPLMGMTGRVGGARPLRSVLGTAADRRRPALVRLAALGAVVPYLDPSDSCPQRLLDTLRRLHGSCWVDHPSYRAASSIEPVLRDSIRAVLRMLRPERGPVGRAAASLGADWRAPERWSESRAAWCRRAGRAFEPALRMSPAVLTSDELGELAACTESGPMALALAWRAAPADTAALTALVRLSAGVRDQRLYRTLLDVARDASRPLPVRVAAVDAVAPLLHPALYWFRTARAQANSPRACSVWGWASHEAVQEEGAVPMGHASRRAGVSELLVVADADVPPAVGDAARTVARCAEMLLNARTPEMW